MMTRLLPYLVTAVLFAGLIWWADDRGYQRAEAICAKGRAAVTERTTKAVEAAQARADAAEALAASAESEVITRFVPVENEVVRYVQSKPEVVVRECLDDDGLRLWNAASAGGGADSLAAGGAGGALPGAPAEGAERARGGPVEQLRGGGAGIPPVPGAAGGTGAVDSGREGGGG